MLAQRVPPSAIPSSLSQIDPNFSGGRPSCDDPDSIFSHFLQGRHGQFLTEYVTHCDMLPSYQPSSRNLNTDRIKAKVPMTLSGTPSLLLFNLPGNPAEPYEPLTKAHTALREAREATQTNNMMIMLGTSGSGKTRTCYEMLCYTWGIYFIAMNHSVEGGSSDIASLEVHLSPKMTGDLAQNREHAEHAIRCAILARLLILHYCHSASATFTPQRWLLLQVAQKTFAALYRYEGDLFRKLTLRLADACKPQQVLDQIGHIYGELRRRLNFDVFLMIMDEAQALQHVLKNKFSSTRSTTNTRSLLSPIIRALVQPTGYFEKHCVVPCGTGLGLLFLEPVMHSGIVKRQLPVARFTNVGGWQDADHVKMYTSMIVDLTEADYVRLYQYFPGRFRPVATCIESILLGTLPCDAVKKIWQIVTGPGVSIEHRKQSIYCQLESIVQGDRPNYISGTDVLALFKSIALSHYYAGTSHIFTNADEMYIVEYGLGRLKTVHMPESLPQLKAELARISGEHSVDDDTLLEALFDAPLDFTDENPTLRRSLVAYVDEPMALTSLYRFFEDHKGGMPKEILQMMANVKDPSSAGTLWQRYLPMEFQHIFDGQKVCGSCDIFAFIAHHGINTRINEQVVSTSPMLEGIPPDMLPSIFKQTATVVKSSNMMLPHVKLGSDKYTLGHYLNENPLARPTFFIPENRAGPDLIFFIRFRDGRTIPVIVQVKLRSSIRHLERILGTTDPRLFYTDNAGFKFNSDGDMQAVKKMMDCSTDGLLRLLVVYPANFPTRPHIRNLRDPSSRITKDQHVIGVISHRNVKTLFTQEHVRFLDTLKDVDIKRRSVKCGE
jgi:hypothetical protein